VLFNLVVEESDKARFDRLIKIALSYPLADCCSIV
jgi:hypothetical protein